MRTAVWIIPLVCSSALADEAPGITVRAPRRWEDRQVPLLHLDIPSETASGVGATTEREARILELGPRARIVVQGEWWKSSLTPQLLGPEIDEVAHGWRTASELSYDLGPFRIAASVALGQVDSRFERGAYRVVGLSVSRTFRLSRWMLGWISFGVSQQQWFGTPPPGESNATTVGLTIGTTFR